MPIVEPPLILVPCLHRQLAEPALQTLEGAASALALWPGLPDPPAGERWLTPDYAYSPAEARACLQDWKALVADRSGSGRALPDDASLRAVLGRPNEARDLERFARTGNHAAQTVTADAAARAGRLREAQRRLIMVWMQEEEVLSIRGALDVYSQHLARLASALGEGEAEELLLAAGQGLGAEAGETGDTAEAGPLTVLEGCLPDDTAALLPSWTFVLDAMAPFLPSGAVLCTADARMAAALEEWGLAPERQEARLAAGPDSAAGSGSEPPAGGFCVSVYRAPLWRFLGRRGPSEAAPWLCQEHELRVVEA